MVSNKVYLLLDLNQWFPPYENNNLTTELSRKDNQMGPFPLMDYEYHNTYIFTMVSGAFTHQTLQIFQNKERYIKGLNY